MSDMQGVGWLGEAAQLLESTAAPEQMEAHRSFLDEVLQTLGSQGVDTQQVAQNAGLPHAEVNSLSLQQLIPLTLQLAREHPDVVQMIAQRFPEAQGILNMVLGMGGTAQPADGGNAGGGLLGGLLGRIGL